MSGRLPSRSSRQRQKVIELQPGLLSQTEADWAASDRKQLVAVLTVLLDWAHSGRINGLGFLAYRSNAEHVDVGIVGAPRHDRRGASAEFARASKVCMPSGPALVDVSHRDEVPR